jgi:acyl carrier protein
MPSSKAFICLEARMPGNLQADRTFAEREILSILDEALNLGGRAAGFDSGTPLLGALPELDSMAVVGLITRIQERFGFTIEDDEIEGATFETVGSLTEFVNAKVAAGRLP